jgi:hypothetical protein
MVVVSRGGDRGACVVYGVGDGQAFRVRDKRALVGRVAVRRYECWTLSPLASTPVGVGNQPLGIASDRSGRNIHVSAASPTPSVLQYAVGRDGTLALKSAAAVPVDTELGDLAVSRTGAARM